MPHDLFILPPAGPFAVNILGNAGD
ncbi:uncharacterized protein METZ01_LOCUS486621, partial [marine metagenome]